MSILESEELWERYLKRDPSLPVYANIGDTVWMSGGTFDDTKSVTVVDDGSGIHDDKHAAYSVVNAGWNSMYYDSYEKAEKHSRSCRSEYGAYLSTIW